MFDSAPRPIAFIGGHVPRRCGIATFTSDLTAAVAREAKGRPCWVAAMNDRHEGYRYQDSVRFEIQDTRLEEYRLAAEYLNMSQVEVACLQHEYGIFGGPSGSYILELLRGLRMPVVTTLHTVLRDPLPEQKAVLQEVVSLSDRVIVMANRAQEFLTRIYQVPTEKVVHIPHGIPDLPFADPVDYKEPLGVEGRIVLLTFGLLSPGKGIEYVIQGLPRIVKIHPQVVYIILGATHPHVRREQGETYRLRLQTMARELGVEEHVIFHNRFVDLDELLRYLGMADVYVTPYLGEAQIVSGTLAYALGAGKAVVSTPYWYAEEMLAEGRGRLVGFRDADAIARNILDLLGHPEEMKAMRTRAYNYCRRMVWRETGRSYLKLFEQAGEGRLRRPRTIVRRATESIGEVLPELDLGHLHAMSDDTGMMQHARFAVPDRRHGYCTDDNARALIVALGARKVNVDVNLNRNIVTYLSFIHHAFDEDSGRFRNFLTFDRCWLDEVGSEDCHGRALWALGVLVRESEREWEQWLGMPLFKQALKALEALHSPRTQAFSMLGLHAYLERFHGDREATVVYDALANGLHARFLTETTQEWMWPEALLTYDNARIPQALLQAGMFFNRPDMRDIALQSLKWLLKIQTSPDGHFTPVGNLGWYHRNGPRARFDQQPLEAGAITEAFLEAHAATGAQEWLVSARLCFDWFLGRNDVRTPLCDLTTGGCRDGLSPQGINQNQGAESTLSWLMAQIAMLRHSEDGLNVGNLRSKQQHDSFAARAQPVPAPAR